MSSIEEKGLAIKLSPMNQKQLTDFFQVSIYIFKKMILKIKNQLGQPICGVYSVNQVLLLIHYYGIPHRVRIKIEDTETRIFSE